MQSNLFKSAAYIFTSTSDVENLSLALFLDQDYAGCLKALSTSTTNKSHAKIFSMALDKGLFDFSCDLVCIVVLKSPHSLQSVEALCQEYEKRGLVTELVSMLEKLLASAAQHSAKKTLTSMLCLVKLKYYPDTFLDCLQSSSSACVDFSWLTEKIVAVFPDAVCVYQKIGLFFWSNTPSKALEYVFKYPAVLSIHDDLLKTTYPRCVRQLASDDDMMERTFLLHLSLFPRDVFRFFKEIPLSQNSIQKIFAKINSSNQLSMAPCFELVQHYHERYDVESINSIFHDMCLKRCDYKSIESSINSKSNFNKQALLDTLASISTTECTFLSGCLYLKMGLHAKAFETFDHIHCTSAILLSLKASRCTELVLQALEVFHKRNHISTFTLTLFHCFDFTPFHSLLSLIWLNASYSQAFLDASFPLIIAKTHELECHLNKQSTN